MGEATTVTSAPCLKEKEDKTRDEDLASATIDHNCNHPFQYHLYALVTLIKFAPRKKYVMVVWNGLSFNYSFLDETESLDELSKRKSLQSLMSFKLRKFRIQRWKVTVFSKIMFSFQPKKLGQIYIKWYIETQILGYLYACLVARVRVYCENMDLMRCIHFQ